MRLLFPLANAAEIDRLTLYFLTRIAASIMKYVGFKEMTEADVKLLEAGDETS